MKRLLVLFLMCVLPLQVFAGVVSSRAAQLQQTPVLLQMQHAGAAHEDHHGDQQKQAPLDDNAGIAGVDDEDFSYHASIGDEPVLVTALMFVAESARLAPALRSDPEIQPPFLPPAGRPPRG
ncbi:hypothetical protein FHW67_002117 [Herbaspirillum sp. Sphag1AN]|uniref:hypothetical protein n=1 Tax=unclassified Herbaspirillum TaxID=2624150 RepID=UPI0016093B52|nr:MULTISPECIES: hypothetical protein [unclassified Herbaspirillum]MBB3212829.1 hypothetical protein [Herbaspirillum sp. Sphag1AN]MBB3246026.1 hypothetical protein [Herbaspirillum sp. Sphag64]